MDTEAAVLAALLLFVWLGLVLHLFLLHREHRAACQRADDARHFFERAFTRLELHQIEREERWHREEIWTGK